MQRMGIPDAILRAWESSLNNMQRCFRIGRGLQPFFRTCSGFPEEDSLPVVPMILCGWLWSAKVSRNPDCISAVQSGERTAIPHVFADNFEVVTELLQKDILQHFIADTEQFAAVLQVELAPRKKICLVHFCNPSRGESDSYRGWPSPTVQASCQRIGGSISISPRIGVTVLGWIGLRQLKLNCSGWRMPPFPSQTCQGCHR